MELIELMEKSGKEKSTFYDYYVEQIIGKKLISNMNRIFPFS